MPERISNNIPQPETLRDWAVAAAETRNQLAAVIAESEGLDITKLSDRAGESAEWNDFMAEIANWNISRITSSSETLSLSEKELTQFDDVLKEKVEEIENTDEVSSEVLDHLPFGL